MRQDYYLECSIKFRDSLPKSEYTGDVASLDLTTGEVQTI